MNLLPDEDISLLFNSLVVLPKDRLSVETETTSTTTHLGAAEPKKREQPNDSIQSQEDSDEVLSDIVAQESKAEYNAVQPFVIVTSQNLKDSYMAADSAFRKILAALNVPNAANHLSADLSILKETDNYTCVWCIGLDIKTEKEILGLDHSNLLVSPDILSLNTTEEKKAMYMPLKAFVSANMDLIVKL